MVGSLNYVRVILDFERVETGSLTDDSRCVGQQVSDSNLSPRVGRSFKKFADFVIEAQLAVLNQEQDACGDKLLADGADFVDGFRSGRNIEFNIRQAVPFSLDNLPVLYDSDGDAGICCLFISAFT
jgi:hypothetical protein